MTEISLLFTFKSGYFQISIYVVEIYVEFLSNDGQENGLKWKVLGPLCIIDNYLS